MCQENAKQLQELTSTIARMGLKIEHKEQQEQPRNSISPDEKDLDLEDKINLLNELVDEQEQKTL